MKRLLKAAVALTMCISLAGCSGSKPETESDSASESKTAAVIPTLKAVESSKLKSDAIEDIPDIEGFAEVLQGIAAEMEMQSVETLTYLKADYHEDTGGTTCMFSFPYENGEAYALFGYYNEEWFAAWVIDAKEATVYWVGEGMEEYLPPAYKKTETESSESSSLVDLEKIKQEAEKTASNSKEITSGDLYDAVISVYQNVKIMDMGESVLFMIDIEHSTIDSDSAGLFYFSNEILKKYPLEDSYSDVSFSMSVDGKVVAMLTLMQYMSAESYKSDFISLNDLYDDALANVYNNGFLKHDIMSSFDSALKDISEKYGIEND